MLQKAYTAEQIIASGIEDPIKDDLEVDCSALAGQYVKASNDAEALNEVDKAEIYKIFGWVCNFHFKPEDKAEPYGPMFVSAEGRRSAIPSDFRGAMNDNFSFIAPSIQNPGLRARLADVAWLNNRKLVDAGKLAISSYLECIRRLLDGTAKLRWEQDKAWDLQAIAMLRRAAVISYAMGRDICY